MKSTLTTVLSPEQRDIYNAVQALAKQLSANVYLVGGAVRDWLMDRPAGDLDFVVEGDALEFAQALQHQYGGTLLVYAKFRTTTWTSRGLHTDIATARSESYLRPAILPTVTPANIDQDLRRRDFTINAMALRLRDETLLDPFGGQADLQRQLIRALHARSFIDDPTRILRAARYVARLGFTVESNTRQWIDAGLPHVKALSGERVKYDLELIFDQTEPERALNLLSEWGIFKSMGIVVPDRDKMAQRFVQARDRLASGEWDLRTTQSALGLAPQELMRAASWGALMYNLGQMSASRWVDLIPFTTQVRDALVSLGVLSTLSSALFGGRPSQQSGLLRSFNGLALLIGWLFDGDTRKRQAMHAEWHTWRAVQPMTTGDDLRARGLPPGPRYRELLARLRNAWLDGEVHTIDEERTLLDKLV